MNKTEEQSVKIEKILANTNLKMIDVEAKIKHCIICGAEIAPIEKVAFKNKCVFCAEKELKKLKENFRIKIYIFTLLFFIIIFYNAINSNSELVEYIILGLVFYCAFKFLYKIFIKRMQIFVACSAIISICLLLYVLNVIAVIESIFPFIMIILISYFLHKDYKAIKIKHNVILRVKIDKSKVEAKSDNKIKNTYPDNKTDKIKKELKLKNDNIENKIDILIQENYNQLCDDEYNDWSI